MIAVASEGFADTVTDGPLLVAAGVAALVGLVGFLSPCVLPLVPGYLSYVAGLSGTDERHPQRRMVSGAVLFVLGFTVIFVAEGLLFGSLGEAIRVHTVLIERILGVVTIVMGLVFLGGFSFLQRELRVHRLPPAGLVGAPLLGAAFGLAWAPCLTPTFSAVFALAYQQGTAARGAFLTHVLLPRTRHSVRPGRPRLRLGVGRARFRAPASASDQSGRRRAADRHRGAARHRHLGSLDELAA